MAAALLPYRSQVDDAQSCSPFVDLFLPYLEGAAREWVLVAGLDARGRLAGFEAREGARSYNLELIPCVRAALGIASVCGVIIAHNHPEGPAHASPQDLASTRAVADLCRLAGARLIDHLIHAPEATISLRESGAIV